MAALPMRQGRGACAAPQIKQQRELCSVAATTAAATAVAATVTTVAAAGAATATAEATRTLFAGAGFVDDQGTAFE